MKGDDYEPTLPAVLRVILDFDGIDARQLAARTGKNEGVLGKWLRGDAAPRYPSIVELADALNAPVEVLLKPPRSRYQVFLRMLAHRGLLEAERDA